MMPRPLVFAALLLVVLSSPAPRAGSEPPYRWLLDDPAQLAQLSEPSRAALTGVAVPPPARAGRDTIGGAAGTPRAALSNPLVNDPTADLTDFDTQSETTLVRGLGRTLVAAFNDSGSRAVAADRFTGLARSTDGGATWTDLGTLPASMYGDGGSPVLAADPVTGRIYLVTLAHRDRHNLLVFRSTDDGLTWLPPVPSTPGYQAGIDLPDKPWLAVHTALGGCRGAVFQVWRNFSGESARGGITFNRSVDGGLTWGPPGGVLLGSGGQGAFVVPGPDQMVFVFWLASNPNRIVMRRSLDCGVTFGVETLVAPLTTTAANGDLGLSFRTNSFPHVAVNPATGHVYVVYSDRGAGGDRANVYLRYSGDLGASFSGAIQVNDDGTLSDQFAPTLAVSPDGARLFITYTSRQLDPANTLMDRWGRIATVSGLTLNFGHSFRISDRSFPPLVGQDPGVSSTYVGAYDMAVADADGFGCTWADTRDRNRAGTRRQVDVRFARVPRDGPGAVLELGGVTVTGGNGDAVLDPDECAALAVRVEDRGSDMARAVTAKLASSTPGVTVVQPAAGYGDIPAGGQAANATPFRVSIAASVPCGAAIDFLLTLTSAAGTEAVLPIRLLSGSGQGVATTAGSTTETPIPNSMTVDAPLTVSGFGGALAAVRVSLYLTHDFTPDLTLHLVAPDGTAVELARQAGTGAAPNYGFTCAERTVFDDAAATAIAAAPAPFLGAFRPNEPLTTFAGRAGAAVNGVWKLRITDARAPDAGLLRCWSLTLVPATCAAGGGACAATRPPDANGNGTVDAIDALCVLRVVAGMAATAACPAVASPASGGAGNPRFP